MKKKEQVSARQFTILVALYTVGDAILYLPAHFAVDAKRDAWIASIFSVLAMFAVVYFLTTLGKRYPGLTIIEYMEIILGKLFGKILLLYFICFCFLDVTLLLMEVGDFLNSQIFPRTPLYVILFLFMSIVVLATNLGTEAAMRTSEIVFPFIVVLFLFMMIALTPQIDLKNIQPILANGILPSIKASRILVGFYLDALGLLMIFPLVQNPKDATKSFYIGTAIGGTFIILISTISILVLGVDTVLRHAYPAYKLAKKISIGNFLERIEIIIAFIWLTSLYFKTYLFFMATIHGFTKLFRLKSQKTIALPIALVMVLIGRIIVPNRTFMDEWSFKHWLPYSIPFGLGIPMILLLVDFIRQKRLNTQTK